jgi:hypothetical protein
MIRLHHIRQITTCLLIFKKNDNVGRPFENLVYVMQSEAVTLMPSCSGGGKVVMA